jgi:hypothetical protein
MADKVATAEGYSGSNSISTVWLELAPDAALPAAPQGISSITFVHHWVASSSLGQFGVTQYQVDDEDCTLLLGSQFMVVPMSAPKLAATTMSLLLSITFLVVVAAKLAKRTKLG